MDKMNQLKMFTLDEANALIPRIRTLIKEIQHKKREIALCEVEIDAAELVNGEKETYQSEIINKLLISYEEKVNCFYAAIDQIHGIGCFLKDIDLGLIDFYSVYQGRVIYLCWQMGENSVEHWHDIGKGFSCRQPLQLDRK